MSNDAPALVVVHTIVLYEAVCHDCGWASVPLSSYQSADTMAELHQCWEAPATVLEVNE